MILNVRSQDNKTYQKLTLQKCLNEALANNIQLKQNKLNINSSEVSYRIAKEALIPTASLSASEVLNSGRTLNMGNYQYVNQEAFSNNFNISSALTLFNGFKLVNALKQNDFNREASKRDFEDYQNTISLNVVQAFIQVVFNKELLKIAQNQVLISQSQTERTQKLVSAGSIAEINYFDLKSQLASDELSVVNAENQLNLAKINLLQMMNWVVNDSLEKYDTENPTIDIDSIRSENSISEIYLKAEKSQPSILSSELKLKSSQFALISAYGNRYPKLTLNGTISSLYSSVNKKTVASPTGFQSFDYPFIDQVSDYISKSVSLNLTIPILNNYQARGGIQNAIISQKNAALNLENGKQALRKKIEQANLDLVAAQKKYYALRVQLSARKASFDVTEKRFNAGLATALDYSVSSNNKIKSESDLLQSQYDLLLKCKILDFYKGIPLDF
jgi:outer membrane protein